MNMNSLETRLQQAKFAAWDAHLYLDTHPCDEEMVQLEEKYLCMADRLTREYEEKYGPLTARTGSGKEWLKAPWPWDNSGREC